MVKILYVDDDRDAGFLASTYLKRFNFQVMRCENTEQARGILASETIDVIISDIGLPGENGIDFYTWLQNEPKYQSLPFIFTSAHAMGFDAKLVEHRDIFIPKPIYFPDLIDKIKELLKLRSS